SPRRRTTAAGRRRSAACNGNDERGAMNDERSFVFRRSSLLVHPSSLEDMGRNIDPVCKMCRREGMKLYLKGARCDSPKCPIERQNRNKPPGMHGQRRGKPSE